MKNLYITGTVKTPEVDLQQTGDLRFKGNSYPENSNEFYKEINAWLDEFLSQNPKDVNLNVDFKYVNTSSIKSILNIILKIRSTVKSKVKVTWMYEMEDDDMYTTGEELSALAKLEFEFVEKKN